MMNELDSPESGALLTLPRPRDRASQVDFLRELSRSRRGVPVVAGVVATVNAVDVIAVKRTDQTLAAPPAERAVAESAPTDLEESEVALSEVALSEVHGWLPVEESLDVPWTAAFVANPDAASWPTTTVAPALSAANWFETTAVETRAVEGSAVDARSISSLAEPAEPMLGLFDILPATTWPDLVAPENAPTDSPDIEGLLAGDPWGAPDFFVEPSELRSELPPEEPSELLAPESFEESSEAVTVEAATSEVLTVEVVTSEVVSVDVLTFVPPSLDARDGDTENPPPSTLAPPPAAALSANSLTLQNRPPLITASTPVLVRCTGLVASRIARGKRHIVLDGVDLTVRSGEVAVITGRSGSGKTTLLECLNGLHRIDAGTVLLGETSVGDATDAEIAELRAASIGYVAQEPHLLADLSAIENIELPLLLSGWDPAEARTEADAAVTLVRLERPNYRTSELSSGERRRVAIARALVGEPSILWCDEMSAAIDPETMVEIYELIFELCHDGLTVVTVTHDPVMLANASTVYELRSGTLHLVSP